MRRPVEPLGMSEKGKASTCGRFSEILSASGAQGKGDKKKDDKKKDDKKAWCSTSCLL